MTLVEILAVLAILSMLAVVLVVNIAPKMGQAKQKLARTQIALISNELQSWITAKSKPPTSGEGLKALSADSAAAWYIEPSKLVDPWGRDYVYLVPGPNRQPFEVVSYGADGQPGGTGDDADISSAAAAGP